VASEVYSVLIGGKAGEGVKKAAQVIAHIAMACGKHVFQEDDYQSLIKGGHNFSIVSISDEILFNSYKNPDLIISFDDRSIRTHSAKLKPGGLHFCNGNDAASAEETAIKLPLSSLMKSVYGEDGNVSLAAVSVFCAQWGIPVETLRQLIDREYRRNQEENRSFAEQVYQLTQEILPHTPDTRQLSPSPAKLYSGNQLIASGAWTAGLDLYFSYPMTPASSILHYLALKRDSHKVYAIHVESELAAANMAIGALFAGKKAAVGSSGGGFALMQEAFSLAGMVEAPLLCFLSSRPGPATGVSTYTAQEDLFFALNQGHGEFPRIVASPDSFERAFTLSAELMDLAWEVQTPAILLTEKHLSESAADIVLSDIDFPQEPPLPVPDESDYKRYAITDSGISPLKFPAMPILMMMT
jgi:2-oxoglutarate ferredoxin oxidoreductase subunit alpha